jgi:DNA-binding MarR family transcriptional regulator
MTQQDASKGQPIGYWIKRLDELITEHADGALRDSGLTRIRWQVLNSIYEAGTIERSEVLRALASFADADQLGAIAADFVAKGWLEGRAEGDAVQWTLTEAGRRAREEAFRRQSEVRRLVAHGITEQEYATVIDVLSRMVGNLEGAGGTRRH